MGRRRVLCPRFLGPYEERGHSGRRWRVIFVAHDGARKQSVYATEAAARAVIRVNVVGTATDAPATHDVDTSNTTHGGVMTMSSSLTAAAQTARVRILLEVARVLSDGASHRRTSLFSPAQWNKLLVERMALAGLVVVEQSAAGAIMIRAAGPDALATLKSADSVWASNMLWPREVSPDVAAALPSAGVPVAAQSIGDVIADIGTLIKLGAATIDNLSWLRERVSHIDKRLAALEEALNGPPRFKEEDAA